jgi:hypothetical protein
MIQYPSLRAHASFFSTLYVSVYECVDAMEGVRICSHPELVSGSPVHRENAEANSS